MLFLEKNFKKKVYSLPHTHKLMAANSQSSP